MAFEPHSDLEAAYSKFLAATRSTPQVKQEELDDDLFEEESSADKYSYSPGATSSSVDKFIDAGNVGFKMLAKLGWTPGKGLGSAQQGRLDPVPFEQKQDFLGVGKKEEENSTHVESTAQRKMMDSEKIAAETAAETKIREQLATASTVTQATVQQSLSAFYCDLCDKQYARISEYNVHLDSYDHNHKKRFKQMKEATKKKSSSSARDKEKAREEKELRRMQEAASRSMKDAAGSKMTAATTTMATKPVTMMTTKKVGTTATKVADDSRTNATGSGSVSGGWKPMQLMRGGKRKAL